MIIVEGVAGLGEVVPGADLGEVLASALESVKLMDHDILVITQKIVSKAEGRYMSLSQMTPGEEARALAGQTNKDPRLVELVLRESSHIVRSAPNVLITRHHLGLVMANAGIDASNIGPGMEDHVLLLPVDPDASAARIRDAISASLGVAPGVLISDSFGRPWRNGVVNVAIGSAGFPVLVDMRGDLDRDGRPMQVTQVAYGDLIASAAGLAMGEAAEGIPAALVRGLSLGYDPRPASALIRPIEGDLFR